jgi:uncharacterized membrane protein
LQLPDETFEPVVADAGAFGHAGLGPLPAVAIDSVMVALFGWYLVAARSVAARAAAKPTRLSV